MANGYGLYDMAGNVKEWVNDWMQFDYYSISPPNDPPGPPTGWMRVLRHGCFRSGLDYVRVAYRAGVEPTRAFDRWGFRCAR